MINEVTRHDAIGIRDHDSLGTIREAIANDFAHARACGAIRKLQVLDGTPLCTFSFADLPARVVVGRCLHCTSHCESEPVSPPRARSCSLDFSTRVTPASTPRANWVPRYNLSQHDRD